MITSTRRHDIDWLRVITIGLLLIYHVTIVFQPWGVFIGFIQSQESIEALWTPMSMINIWRIPLLFFVSGMGVCFAIKKRSWKQLIIERTRRILLPFLFGIIFIVPIHVIIWQYYYKQDIAFMPQQGHLWFLKNIFIYVVVLSPVFFYLRKQKDGFIGKWLKRLFKNPLGWLLVIAALLAEAVIVNPETFELYAMTTHGFVLGLLAFLFGFLFVISGETFWPMVLKWRWLFLVIAFSMYLIRFFIFSLKSPNYWTGIESPLWIFAMFGIAYRYLNNPSKTLTYLSQGAYPIYIVHMIFIYLGSILILPLNIPVFIKFLLLSVFTFLGSLGLYDLVIRRIPFLRPLFGLKKLPKTKVDPVIEGS